MTNPDKVTPEEKLLSSMEDAHSLASGALSRIHGISKCALRSLETDAGVRDLEAIAEALKAIALDADMARDSIGAIAEEHGIQTTSKEWRIRLKAMAGARESHEHRAAFILQQPRAEKAGAQ
jgi:hypothetical protein